MRGAPRCRHCGGPGDQDGPGLGFYFDRGVVPRIKFRCELELTSECKGIQSIACEKSWRLLLASRFTPRYQALSVDLDDAVQRDRPPDQERLTVTRFPCDPTRTLCEARRSWPVAKGVGSPLGV